MFAEIDFLILPYASAEGRSLAHVLVEELGKPDWSAFHAAVAFVRPSGNSERLLDALGRFASDGREVSLTFGADTFAEDARGSDYAAVEELLTEFSALPNVKVHLYHEKGRTFHPKIYLFSNEEAKKALVIVGSSNWGSGGLVSNVEASVMVRLDLSNPDHERSYEKLNGCFKDFWSGQ